MARIEHLEMPSDLMQRLTETAAASKQKVECLITTAIREFLEREEEKKELIETMKGIDDLDNGRTVDGELVFEWMKSLGTESERPSPLLSK
jgi:predicted transcriptional regulator